MSSPSPSDYVATYLSADGELRIRFAQTSEAVGDATRRHQLGPFARLGLARALTSAALIPMTWKDADRVSVQWTGLGALGSLVAEVRVGGEIRGYASRPEAAVPASVNTERRPHTLGFDRRGLVVVTRQASSGRHTESRAPLAIGSVDGDLQHWFSQSEQVPTRVRVDAEPGATGAVAGLLVQSLPGERGRAAAPERLIEWDAARELTSASFAAWLDDVEPGARILEQQALQFTCPCSRERSWTGIQMLDASDLRALLDEEQGAEVRCEFCSETYNFDADELEQALAEKLAKS